ncbi:MAG: SRPBCC family protein, partial [Candidatus Hydrogenedentes bacterium]|nr:SRPBCC family protein [Candidatus Hydrogenedentota bacterium]
MKITNIHEREMQAAPESVGALLDSLSSPADALWPRRSWPPMILDRPLSVGATGGHGPVRYVVDSYTPGQAVT